jgi:hypothetical protein
MGGGAKSVHTEDADVARKRFGNAKSISSAQFNSEDDSSNDYEKQV